MAEIKNQHANKFLDLRGVEILWNKIKEQIKNTADGAKLESVSYNSADDKITVEVGNTSLSATIAKATATNNGLISKEDFSKLSNIATGAQVNVIEGVAVRGTITGAVKSSQLPIMQVEGADYSVAVLDVEANLSTVTAESDPFHVASAYAAKAYADTLAQSAKDARDTLEGKINTVSGVAKANADAIAALQATAATYALASDLNTVSGVVSNNRQAISNHALEFNTYKTTVADTLEQLENRISGTASELATRVDTLESTSSSHASLLEGLRTDVDANATAIRTAASDAAKALATAKDELTANIDTVNAAVAVLNSNSSVTGSVDYKVKTAIDAVVDGAPAAFDTLKEVATWISTETSGAAALATRISDLENNKLDVTTFNSFKDTNTQAIDAKLNISDFDNAVASINATLDAKANTSDVNNELAKKLDISAFNEFKDNNTEAISEAVAGEADVREKADDTIKAAAVTTITSSYDATSGQLSINYDFIDPTNATSFVLCESISDDELNSLFA